MIRTPFQPSNLKVVQLNTALVATVSPTSPMGFFSSGKMDDRVIHSVHSTLPFASAQRDGYKSPTEDRVINNFRVSPRATLFAVLDGHGGCNVVNFVSEALPRVIHEKLCASDSDKLSEEDYILMLQQLLIESFVEVDEQLLKSPHLPMTGSGGTTATVALITESHVVVANVGDSPCLAFSKRNGQTILHETNDHDLRNPAELKRVLEVGGNVGFEFDGTPRVNGSLAVTRAFGHKHLKYGVPLEQRVVTALPQTYTWPRSEDMMLVLCSDSFTEQYLTDPKPMIRNNLHNSDILHQVYDSLRANCFDLSVTVESLVTEQVQKFFFPVQGYAGDNTSITLIDLSMNTQPFSPMSIEPILESSNTISPLSTATATATAPDTEDTEAFTVPILLSTTGFLGCLSSYTLQTSSQLQSCDSFTCDIESCQKVFRSRKGLKRHAARIHK